MKKISFALMALVMTISGSLMGQVTPVFNYQAVCRIDGEIAANINAELLVSVWEESNPDSILWEGSYSIQTNDYGLFTVPVGALSANTGNGIYPTLDKIHWSIGNYFVTLKVNGQLMGDVPLAYVPFSLYARVSDSLGKVPVIIQAPGNENPDDALFAVKRDDGQTVFAVYNDGVRVYLDTTTAKGPRGGFAIGGYGATKGAGQEYFRVTQDSTRVYVSSGAKGNHGGFAIGGYGATKGTPQDYLRVTQDSTRVYVNSSAKGNHGGFAIGGFGVAKGAADRFLDLTPLNYFIGHKSGSNITTGVYNIFLGYQAGLSNTMGCYNTFIGYKSGYSNIGMDTTVTVLLHGQNNTFIGYLSGYANTMGDYNTFIGCKAGISNTEGRQNIFLGYGAGMGNDQGYFNVFLGNFAGRSNTSGYDNLFVGSQSGAGNTTGTENTYFGTHAGKGIATGNGNTMVGYAACPGYLAFGDDGTGSNNVYMGYQSAYNNKNGSGNVFLGYKSGYNATDMSNRLYIDNSETDTPLIYGEFDNRLVRINGDLCYTGTFGQCSDLRLKTALVPLGKISRTLLSLTPYYFHWKHPDPEEGFSGSRQIGLVAQEVKKYFPELVSSDNNGTLYVDYSKLSPLLLEVVKEQQQQMDRQDKIIDDLAGRVARLEKALGASGQK